MTADKYVPVMVSKGASSFASVRIQDQQVDCHKAWERNGYRMHTYGHAWHGSYTGTQKVVLTTCWKLEAESLDDSPKGVILPHSRQLCQVLDPLTKSRVGARIRIVNPSHHVLCCL
jgi:hypothetical protein